MKSHPDGRIIIYVSDMRIAVLCNDRVALPALDFILSSGMAAAVGMPARPGEVQTPCQGQMHECPCAIPCV